MDLAFDEQGLIPVIAQDHASGEILMVAWANADAVARTESTGELHLWSRSRQEPWHKGATSGNTLAVKALRTDCDNDVVIAQVEAAGPACHTGARSCFAQDGEPDPLVAHEALPALERTIAERKAAGGGGYTGKLLEDLAFTGAKVEEEAEEVARAAREESDERVASEAADVLYHLTVLLHGRGLTLADAHEVLLARRG